MDGRGADMQLVELMYWSGLLFVLRMLKGRTGHVNQGLETLAETTMTSNNRFRRPQSVADGMGCYRKISIYRYVVIDGKAYQFDRIRLDETTAKLAGNKRCIAPRLIYLQRGLQHPPAQPTRH
jgi:hypothetical protein